MTQASMSSQPWLIGARADLVWLIGSSTLAFAAVGAFYLLTGSAGLSVPLAIGTLYVLWTVGFDGTHFFATYSRTLLCPEFRREQAALLWLSVSLFAIGPALLIEQAWLFGVDSVHALSFALNRFALTWAYYHICRQHWGVAALYRRKGGESDPRSRQLEAVLLASGFAFPYFYAVEHSATPMSAAEFEVIVDSAWLEAASNLGLIAALSFSAALVVRTRQRLLSVAAGWFALVSLSIAIWLVLCVHVGSHAPLYVLRNASGAVFGASLLATLARAVLSRGPVNWPKWLMIGSALVAHGAILAMTALPAILPILALTLFHDVQYHRIVRFHNVNRYGVWNRPVPGSSAVAPRSWAERSTQSLTLFCGLALAFSLFYCLLRVVIPALGMQGFGLYLYVAALWGVPMHHYMLDGVIWRPGRSQQVRSGLGLGSVARA